MERIETLFEKAKPVLGERKAKSLWLAYTTETDLNKRREIEGFLYSLLAKKTDETFQKKKILLEPPSEDKCVGDYPLGAVYFGDKLIDIFGLNESQLLAHTGIWGMTGSGKTNIVYLIVSNLMKNVKNFLIFDWKRNFRDLLETKANTLKVYTVGREISPFYWNPLIPPPNTDPSVWLKQFIEVCQHALFLGHGVENILQKVFDALYLRHSVYFGNNDSYPTLEEAKETLDKYKARGREAQWLDSTKRAMGALCFGGIGKVLNVNENSELNLNQNIVFELDSLTDSEKTFFTEIILLWIFHKRLTESEREKFKHCVVIEEAHHILFREKQRVSGKETIVDIILRQIRELGEGFIVIDQQPSLITPTALANIHTHIAMKMFYPDDVSLTAKLLNLKQEDLDFLRMLKTGWGIVKIPDWHKPFLVKFDLYPVNKGLITDEKLEWGFYSTPSIEESYNKLQEKLDKVNREFQALDNIEKISPLTNDLADPELNLLVDIGSYPFSGIAERYHRLNLNAYRGNKIKNTLIQKGLVTDEPVSNLKGILKLLIPTKLGIEKLKEHEVLAKSLPPNTSFEHEFWKFKVKEFLESKGYKVEEEVLLENGHRVDLVAEKDKEKIAIEIETGKSDALNNVGKCLEYNFELIMPLVLSKKLKVELEKKVSELVSVGSRKIEVKFVGDFLK